ncbi:MAG: hypothetical protein OXC46_02395, partial [Thaumarchaeota archaeon]|nr:hypothetical protein [Nitrososphaerota archaeon]
MNKKLQEYDISVIKEMIRLIFDNFRTKKSQHKIPKKTIHKILFNVGKSLPEDNPVKSTIPFYWYLDGPFSETIDHTIRQMKKEKIILLNDGKYELYTYNTNLQHKRFFDHQENNFDKIRNVISSNVSGIGGFSNLYLVRDVYDDSPILFYPNYKAQFLTHFESYCKYRTTNNLDNHITEESLILELGRSVLSIPLTPTFSDFKILFLKFEDVIKKTFEYKNKKNSKYAIALKNLNGYSKEIWVTFAHGARILKHDSYYQDQIAKWEYEFLRKTETLNESMFTTIEIVEKNLEIQINSDYTQDK